MSESKESEKDWYFVKINPEEESYVIEDLKKGKNVRYILTSNYTLFVTQRSHAYFKQKEGLTDEDIISEGDVSILENKLKLFHWPHHRADWNSTLNIEDKLNEILLPKLKQQLND